MSFVGEYVGIKQELSSAISDALHDMAREILPELKKQAESIVYTYQASERAMETRRGTIADEENFQIEFGENFVSLTNIAEMQGADYGTPEIQFVEDGLGSYRQPYPRPFMEKARDEYIDSGKADQTLARAMQAHGFSDVFTVSGE